MYKVQYKSDNAAQAWSTHGTYGSEQSALREAKKLSSKMFMVRVLDPDENVVWSS
jgi:hypothetical protein